MSSQNYSSLQCRAQRTIRLCLMLSLASLSLLSWAPGVSHAQHRVSDEYGQLFYEVLVAELAIRRGELAVAAEGYLQATERSDDPRVAERATQLAIYYQQWDAAERAASRWLLLDPESIDAHETLAQVYLRSGKEAETGVALKGWIDSSADESITIQVINQVLLNHYDRELAYRVSTELANHFPEQAYAHVGKAQLALSVSDRGSALTAANDALALDGTMVDALLVKAQVQISQGQSPDAVVTLQTAVGEQPNSLPLHLGFAQLLVESELYDRAGPVIARAAELSDRIPETLLQLGLLALTAERVDQAQDYLTGVVEQDPFNERAQFYLGRIADRASDNDTAIAHFDSVPQGDFYFMARLRSAELVADSGRIEAGLERLKELSPLASDASVKIQLITAESRILQSANRKQEAVSVLSNALALYPDNPELLYSRAIAAEKAGDDTLLENDLLKIIADDPNNAHALNALGYHLAVNNLRLDEAERYLEKAMELAPGDAAITDSLGWLRFKQGRLNEAKQLLSEAYSMYPDGEIAAHLGEVLWVMGDTAAAQTVWNKALALDPDLQVLKDVINRFVAK